MGWQDAPLVTPSPDKAPAWASAPVVGATGAQPAAPAQPPQSMAGFVGGNLAKGAAQVAGIPAEIGRQLGEPLTSPAAEKFNKIIKAPTPKADQPMAGSPEHIEDLLKQHGIITQSAEPRTTAQKYGAAALQALPSAAIPGGAAKVLPRVGAAIGSGLGGEAGKQIGGVPGQIAGSLIGGGLGAVGGLAVGNAMENQNVQQQQTNEQLSQQQQEIEQQRRELEQMRQQSQTE